jgi:hypothetical protein
MFQLPADFAGSFASSTSGALVALAPFYTPVLAVLLGTTVVLLLIQAIRHH